MEYYTTFVLFCGLLMAVGFAAIISLAGEIIRRKP